jgi:hypothetical protein
MQDAPMRCFSCDAETPLAAGERVGFRDDCAACGRDLHCCRNCAHHDPAAYNECRESSAERVSDREAANRCDYFSPGTRTRNGTSAGADDSRAQALAELDALFKK